MDYAIRNEGGKIEIDSLVVDSVTANVSGNRKRKRSLCPIYSWICFFNLCRLFLVMTMVVRPKLQIRLLRIATLRYEMMSRRVL